MTDIMRHVTQFSSMSAEPYGRFLTAGVDTANGHSLLPELRPSSAPRIP